MVFCRTLTGTLIRLSCRINFQCSNDDSDDIDFNCCVNNSIYFNYDYKNSNDKNN